MRIFTLGKRGMSFFLFAFILLIGNLPSYGQETCPSDAGTASTQEFCYLQTVSDIATDASNPAVYQTADTENDTQPIPGDELLSDGVTYYVGSATAGTCVRVPVTVTVNSAAAPDNTVFPGSTSFTLSPCVGSNLDVTDLEAFFIPATNYEIVVYTSEFESTEATGELVPGENYFVGQVSGTGCPSVRVAVGYNPTEAPAPTAISPQTFCVGATVADLVAEGTSPDTQTIRWYRTETSIDPLDPSTQLINGATYYATQIINDRNDPFPPCESTERAAVVVELLEADAGADNTDAVTCQTAIEGRLAGGETAREIFLSLLEAGVPTDGTFNPSINTIAAEYSANPIGTFETTYTVTNELGCEDSAELALTVTEDPNAGDGGEIVFCQAELQALLLEYQQNPEAAVATLLAMVGPDIDTDGTFTNLTLDQIAAGYLAAVNTGTFPFNAQTTYTVTRGDCSDSAEITITVYGTLDAGADNSTTYCNTEIPALVNEVPGDVEDLYFALLEDGVPQTGTFEPTIEEIIEDYNTDNTQDFLTTYTITNEGGCTDSVDLTITVTEPTPANAGTIADQTVACSSSDPVLLADFLSPDATTGGTFSGTGVSLNASNEYVFDPSVGAGAYEITYTVSEDPDNCITGEASTTFTMNVSAEANAGADNSTTYCNTEIPALVNEVPGDVEDLYFALLEEGVPQTGTFNPTIEDIIQEYNEDNFQDFTTTYTVGTGECFDSVELTITVNEPAAANAGDITDQNVCSTDGIITLSSFLPEGASTGGTFSGENVNEADGTFDTSAGPNEDGYQITYSVDDTADCVIAGTEDSDSFTIFVAQGAELGEDITRTFCETEISPDLTVEEVNAYFLSLIEGLPTEGTFEPTPAELFETYQADPTGTFSTVYTVGTEPCGDSVMVTVVVNETQDANAGEIADQTVCSTDGMIDLSSFIPEGATTGGIFSGVGVTDGSFDASLGPNEAGYEITYSVDDTADCVTEGTEDSATFTIFVTEGVDLGDDITETLCITEIDPNLNLDTLEAYFLSLAGDVPAGGTFEPTAEELFADFQADPTSTFTTTYTVGSESCGDSVDITVTINDIEDANAGEIADQTVCSTDAMITLSDLLAADATTGGTFSGEGVTDGTFDPSLGPVEGGYEITYTVDDSADCVTEGTSDVVTFTIFVNEGVELGDDITRTVCLETIDPNLDAEGVEAYFNNLVENLPEGGSFEPTPAEIFAMYQDEPLQTFITNYTVSNGNCDDSVEIAVTVVDSFEADAGEDVELTFCSTEGVQNLYDFLDPAVSDLGTFEGLENGMFDPSTAELGVTTINYVIDEAETPCATGNDTAEFIITVNAPEAADAGDDVEAEFCLGQTEDIELTSLLPEGIQTTGTFSEPYEDGTFNPSVAGIGEFTVIYTLEGEEACVTGTDSSEITITVIETIEAPTATDVTFCASQAATVADLEAEGAGEIQWFLDEELTTPANEEDVLVEGAYYAVSVTEGGCQSEPVMITVTLTDGAAPTLVTDGNVFCDLDRPTIADLESNIVETGTVTFYDAATGGNVLGSSDLLEDDTTYYAALTSSEGCESSERLAITVDLETCDIIIPEAFSPNGDGINDRFEIEGLAAEYPNYNLQVFNRWGNKVFEGNASTPAWDGVSSASGTLGDDVLPVGVYFYILDFNDGQTAPVQGRVYLSR
ncbi:MAG TPA: gliding motility-associated C-terminal domain-containing protein [Salinimicrobium sp.]|nr:gliding motility-associated C-terminal domain-containing protein [Salinimicrobium sp.]